VPGAEFSAVQVKAFTRETWEVGRVPMEDGDHVGAVVCGPFLDEAFRGGGMGSVVEAEAVEENCEVDIGVEPLG
jgi:hypothetical protein